MAWRVRYIHTRDLTLGLTHPSALPAYLIIASVVDSIELIARALIQVTKFFGRTQVEVFLFFWRGSITELIKNVIVSLGVINRNYPGSFQEVGTNGRTTNTSVLVKLQFHKLTKT